MNQEILDFEDMLDDVVEVVTPQQVEARLRTSWSAWDKLYQGNKTTPYIADEYKRFKQWIIPTLASESSLWFASGTLNQLDRWDARYKAAYLKAANITDVVSPENNTQYKLQGLNPFIVFGAGIIGGLLLWLFLSKSSIKRLIP